MDERTAELLAAARDMLNEGEHEGGCVNVIGDDPESYSEYDSCALHLQASDRRRARLRRAVAAFD